MILVKSLLFFPMDAGMNADVQIHTLSCLLVLSLFLNSRTAPAATEDCFHLLSLWFDYMLNPNWCVQGSSLGRCHVFPAEPGPVLGKETFNDPINDLMGNIWRRQRLGGFPKSAGSRLMSQTAERRPHLSGGLESRGPKGLFPQSSKPWPTSNVDNYIPLS